MRIEQGLSPNDLFPLHVEDHIRRIPNVAYVGSHPIDPRRPDLFALPNASFSTAQERVSGAFSVTNHMVGLRQGDGDFGMSYDDYFKGYVELRDALESWISGGFEEDVPQEVHDSDHPEEHMSVGRLYCGNVIGRTYSRFNSLATALGAVSRPESAPRSADLTHLTIITAYPTEDFAREILGSLATDGKWLFSPADREAFVRMQTCIPFSESQLASKI